MKKMNLNDTWKLCLQMWKWVAAEVRKAEKQGHLWCVNDLKGTWARKHGFEGVKNHCFFCGYSIRHPRRGKYGCNCPAKKVDPSFDCCDSPYNYNNKPIAFYNKIVELNKKRRKK